MAFNLGGFLMGASTQLVKSIEEEEERLQEEKLLKEEREYQQAEYKRRMDLTTQSDIAKEERAEKKELENLMQQAVFHFGTDYAPDLAKNGKGYLMQAINMGNVAAAAGRRGREYLIVNNGNIEEATKDLNKATINVGDQTQQALAPTRTISFDFEKLGRDVKTNAATSLDDLLALSTLEQLQAIESGDPKAVDAANQKTKTILDSINKADPETVEEIFSNPVTFFTTMRSQAIGDAGAESGEYAQVLSKFKGDPLFGATMNYDAAVRMENQISGYSDPRLTANVKPFIDQELARAEETFKSQTTDLVREFQTGSIFGKDSAPEGKILNRSDILYVNTKDKPLPTLEQTESFLLKGNIKPKRGVAVIITNDTGSTRVVLNTEVLRKGSKYYSYNLE